MSMSVRKKFTNLRQSVNVWAMSALLGEVNFDICQINEAYRKHSSESRKEARISMDEEK